MLLTPTEINAVMVHMGYDSPPTNQDTFYASGQVGGGYGNYADILNDLATRDIPAFKVALINSAVLELDGVKAAYQQARADSMAVKVGDLVVDYPKHISFLKSEGKRLEKLLSNLVGIFHYISYFGGTTASRAVSFIAYG